MNTKFVAAAICCATLFLGLPSFSSEASASIWSPGGPVPIAPGDRIYVRREGTGAVRGALHGGGEFAVFVEKENGGSFDAPVFGNLFSYCLEPSAGIPLNEMEPDRRFRVNSVTQSIHDGSSFFDTLDPGTLFLFEQYATCNLQTHDLGGGVNFAYSQEVWVSALQQAIWELQEADYGLQPISDEAELLIEFANNNSGDYQGGVVALNLVDFDSGENIQDLLWYQPITPTNNPVPEPATLGMWILLGAAGLSGVRLRKKFGQKKTA